MNPPNTLIIFIIFKLVWFWKITAQEMIAEELFSEPLLETDRPESLPGFDFRSMITSEHVDDSANAALLIVDEVIHFETNLLEQNIQLQPDTPSFDHNQFFSVHPSSSGTDPKELTNHALRIIQATLHLKQKFNFTNEQAGFGLMSISTIGTVLEDTCRPQPDCTFNTKYRTIDGSCNNLKLPIWGMARTVFQRILTPHYNDGVYEPRFRGADGCFLPSPRLISTQLIMADEIPREDISLMLMVFGQFVDHDLTLAPISVLPNSQGIDCCSADGSDFLAPGSRHPQCFPIEIPADDKFYGKVRQRCMNFVRTMPGPSHECNFGHAEQLNLLTHWLDCSQIYGSDSGNSLALRQFDKGRLRMERIDGHDRVPFDPTTSDSQCRLTNLTVYKAIPLPNCGFLTGDVRMTEQPQLTVMHTLWLREHNRIAEQLSRLYPGWGDEVLFQESRRIVIAEYQHIVYKEFLPIILGNRYITTHGLSMSSITNYSGTINPSIHNEFAAAAFRMGHSMIQGLVKLFRANGQLSRERSFTLSQLQGRSPPTSDVAWMDDALRGLLEQPIQSVDPNITPEVTNWLFRGSRPFGLDLASLNIQRGRDHGIKGYNSYREICGLKKALKFEDFEPEIPSKMIGALKRAYRSVDDVDLFVGGLMEKPAEDALVGPTFVCIIGDQFARLRRGDRFFYDIQGQPHSFTQSQLNEIRKANFARIVCDHNDGSIQSIQASAFRTCKGMNIKMKCDNIAAIPRLELSNWAEN